MVELLPVDHAGGAWLAAVVYCDGYSCRLHVPFLVFGAEEPDTLEIALRFDHMRTEMVNRFGWTVWPDAGEFCARCSLRFN